MILEKVFCHPTIHLALFLLAPFTSIHFPAVHFLEMRRRWVFGSIDVSERAWKMHVCVFGRVLYLQSPLPKKRNTKAWKCTCKHAKNTHRYEPSLKDHLLCDIIFQYCMSIAWLQISFNISYVEDLYCLKKPLFPTECHVSCIATNVYVSFYSFYFCMI